MAAKTARVDKNRSSLGTCPRMASCSAFSMSSRDSFRRASPAISTLGTGLEACFLHRSKPWSQSFSLARATTFFINRSAFCTHPEQKSQPFQHNAQGRQSQQRNGPNQGAALGNFFYDARFPGKLAQGRSSGDVHGNHRALPRHILVDCLLAA